MYKVTRKTFSDGPAKTVYASLLNEGAVAMSALLPKSTFTAVTPVPQEGWALKETKKPYRFNEKQRRYLEAKFSIGQATGRKLDAEIIAMEMWHALGSDGRRLFKSSTDYNNRSRPIFPGCQQRFANK